MMEIFGLVITTRGQAQAELASFQKIIDAARAASVREIEYWKEEYRHARARAIVAEQFQRKTQITVKPVAMGVDSGVRIEVGLKSDTEIREA